jgi:single-stranded-DNA-specific exonuclease
MSRDPVRAAELAAELDAWNRERQSEEVQVVDEARQLFLGRAELPPILVGWSESWHKGVVGVAAGRIARDFHRPTLLLAVAGDSGISGVSATGSGRSVSGINLHEFLSPWKDRMERFGGHAQAVGMTVATDRLEELRGEWEAAAAEWPASLLVPRLEYELHLPPSRISQRLLADLQRLEPFGQGNPRPLVRTGPLRLDGPPRYFGKGHLGGRARGEDGGQVELVGWGWRERESDLAGWFEVLGCLEEDSYRGEPVLRLVDSRPANL